MYVRKRGEQINLRLTKDEKNIVMKLSEIFNCPLNEAIIKLAQKEISKNNCK